MLLLIPPTTEHSNTFWPQMFYLIGTGARPLTYEHLSPMNIEHFICVATARNYSPIIEHMFKKVKWVRIPCCTGVMG